MSERITTTTLYNRCASVNRRLDGPRVMWQGRNGYVALDEYDASGSCLRTLTVGTKREVAEFLHAMMVGMDLRG